MFFDRLNADDVGLVRAVREVCTLFARVAPGCWFGEQSVLCARDCVLCPYSCAFDGAVPLQAELAIESKVAFARDFVVVFINAADTFARRFLEFRKHIFNAGKDILAFFCIIPFACAASKK